MSRLFCLFGFILFLSVQTGCQTGPLMEISKLTARDLPTDSSLPDENLAAYEESLPVPAKKINSIPTNRIPVASLPLGYRRGYQPCNT